MTSSPMPSRAGQGPERPHAAGSRRRNHGAAIRRRRRCCSSVTGLPGKQQLTAGTWCWAGGQALPPEWGRLAECRRSSQNLSSSSFLPSTVMFRLYDTDANGSLDSSVNPPPACMVAFIRGGGGGVGWGALYCTQCWC